MSVARSHRPLRARRRWPCAGVAVAATLAALSAQVYAQNPPLAASESSTVAHEFLDKQEELQFDLNVKVLTDPGTRLDTRRAAAAALIESNWAIAIRKIKSELLKDDLATHRAIALAISDADAPSPQFIRPLVALLRTENVELRRELAAALGRYEDPWLVTRLIELATGETNSEAQRRGAVRALAEHRKPQVVDALLLLARTARDFSLRSLAFESLAKLTGVKGYGENLALWEAWWQRARRLDETRLMAMLLRNVSARHNDANKELQAVTARLMDAHARWYDATPDGSRLAVLEEMLRHSDMAEVRLQGLKLVERRLLNAQPVEEPLRALVRDRLEDGHPPVRILAAKVLENMSDAPAATRVVTLLNDYLDESVQRAYLGLLARMPVDGALEAAMTRVTNVNLRGPALAVLIAAVDAGKLPPQQADQVRDLLRAELPASQTPHPNALRLLGRLGDGADEPLLTALLKHPDSQVRLAAAEALAADRWPLEPLLNHLKDETIGPLAMQIVGRRAAQLDQLLKLLEAEPAEADRQRTWREAAVSICTRLNTEGLLALARLMLDQSKGVVKPSAALYEAMLTAASKVEIDSLRTPDPAVVTQLQNRRWEANFLLADYYLDSGQPALAAEPVDRLLSEPQTLTQQRRVGLLQLAFLLHQIQIEPAKAHTSKLLSDATGPSINTVAMKWVEVIRKLLPAALAAQAGGNTAPLATVQTMFAEASTLFNGKLDAQAAAAMDDLRQAFQPASASTANGGGVSSTPSPNNAATPR